MILLSSFPSLTHPTYSALSQPSSIITPAHHSEVPIAEDIHPTHPPHSDKDVHHSSLRSAPHPFSPNTSISTASPRARIPAGRGCRLLSLFARYGFVSRLVTISVYSFIFYGSFVVSISQCASVGGGWVGYIEW